MNSAEVVVVLHLAFIAFVAGGGLFALRWPRIAWIHLPAVAWGAWVQFADWICPLTYLEDTDAHGSDSPGLHSDRRQRLDLHVGVPEASETATRSRVGCDRAIIPRDSAAVEDNLGQQHNCPQRYGNHDRND